jgi:hypothetical protein
MPLGKYNQGLILVILVINQCFYFVTTHCTDVVTAQPTTSGTTGRTLVSHHPDQSNPLSGMILRGAILGKRFVLGISSPVNGLVLCPSTTHFSISVFRTSGRL